MKKSAHVAAVMDNEPGRDSEDTASNSFTLLLQKWAQMYYMLLNIWKAAGHKLFNTD